MGGCLTDLGVQREKHSLAVVAQKRSVDCSIRTEPRPQGSRSSEGGLSATPKTVKHPAWDTLQRERRGAVTGTTGLAIVDAILADERDPAVLANLRDPRIHGLTLALVAITIKGGSG